MSRRFALISSAFLLTLGLSISCQSEKSSEPEEPSSGGSGTVITDDGSAGTIVYQTDSTEWRVKIFKEHLLYSEALAVELPEPWHIPTREEATFLRTLTYPSEERFVTCDGYTFLMPSASVTKAGEKTKYSILGLYIRRSVIIVEF